VEPSGISTLGGDAQVSVRWNTVPGADSYNVYWSQKAATPKEQATKVSVKTGPFEHKGIANNTVYYYRVSAVNANGESPLSPETGAMPRSTPPGQPSGVAAMGGDGKITLKWAPVEGATSYNVFWSTKPGLEKSKRTKVADVKQPPYEHKDVKKKTMYFYIVSAVNAGGESPVSTESGAMP
jgi:pectate lyase